LTSPHAIRTLTLGMRSLKRTHGVVATALLVIAIVAVLGHVCVLPVHAHAVPVEGHGSHGDAPSDNSVHTASCDALKSTSTTPSMVPIATAVPVVFVEQVSLRRSIDIDPASWHAESPPLFLLHAALLI
jgi:hypothetical protein